jgi:hypothetical protein
MKLVSDIDVTLFIAIALSAKRGPADLAAIMAAAELTPGALAAEFKLTDAFHRLSTHGLISAQGNGIGLTAIGEDIMAGQPKKAATVEIRIARIQESLAEYHASGEDEPIGITVEQVRAAIAAHRLSARVPGRNMLLPKPKVDPAKDKRKAPWRKSAGPRRR